MSVRVFSASINGIDAQLIEVEVDSSPGIHTFNIVGLPSKSVEESKDRIAAAIKNSQLLSHKSTNKKIVINLAPADVRKDGPFFDLPMAIGYLLEAGQIKFDPSNKLFIGELSLDGSLKHTNGVIATAIMAKKIGFSEIIIPRANIKEASIVDGIDIIGARDIKEVINHLMAVSPIDPYISDSNSVEINGNGGDSLLFIKGQETAKRSLTVAAAGAHNVIMSGPPGSGKTLLAKGLRELLPEMSLQEAIEVAKIYSSVGLIKDTPLSFLRPFRNPHHTTSSVAVIGGGARPKPGEISLAHRGVLFLDELPEFPRNVLESLRQPLEDGVVSVSRASGSVVLPAKFTFVAAMNPCPCGNYGQEKSTCFCPPFGILRYRKKISGPLLDRIDIQISVPRETLEVSKNYDSNIDEINSIKNKIKIARDIQTERFKDTDILTNSEISYKNIDKYCILTSSAEKLLEDAIDSRGLSMRTYHKIKKLARTIADLDQSDIIQDNHIGEAVNLKVNEKSLTELV